MRKILFRGKRMDNGEWVKGMPCSDLKGGVDSIQSNIGGGIFDVIPETVGQYTGLKDKNGKRIFEGDILQTGTIKGDVVWNEKRVEYCFLWKDYGKRTDVLKSPNLAAFMLGRNIEIIGNIHDNPELLEGT